MRTKGTIVKKCILSIFIIFASNNLWADEQEPIQLLSVLQSKIESHVLNELANHNTEGTIKVSAGKIDPRLKLRVCADDKLEVFNPYENSSVNTNTMGIKCTEELNHWTLYVPVKITVLKKILVTKNALKKDQQIDKDDFYSLEMDTQKLKQGYFTDPKQLVGLVCKKDIGPDTPFNPYNLELAKVVRKGQEVHIIATSGNLKISMGGIAMSDGSLGDIIKVQNATSKKIVEAQVSGKQQVTITL
jgi:flagella basal body P-ring formation protein FlgA